MIGHATINCHVCEEPDKYCDEDSLVSQPCPDLVKGCFFNKIGKFSKNFSRTNDEIYFQKMEEKLKLKENASMSTLIIVENGKVKESNNCFVIVKETIVTLMKNVIAENTTHNTVFENNRKSLIQHCERSEQKHLKWTKVN